MISEISLADFKSFKRLENLEIKPLTLLCGANSAGKTSIMKSLVLLKQSFDNSITGNEATLNGQYVQCGTMNDVIYKHDGNSFKVNNIFVIKVTGKKFTNKAKQDITASKELNRIFGFCPYVTAYKIETRITLKKTITSLKLDKNIIDEFVINISLLDESSKTIDGGYSRLRIKNQSGRQYDIDLENFPTINNEKRSHSLKRCVCYFSGMKLVNLFYDVGDIENLSFFLPNIYALFRIVADQYKGLQYVGPIRDVPRRHYSLDSCSSLNGSGMDSAISLAKEPGRNVCTWLFPPEREDNYFSSTQVRREKYPLSVAVQDWMSYFELGKINIDAQDDSFKVLVDGDNIADVGFGISQTFPIIVYGLSMNYEQTLILEQPEIHLHPRMQMRMADFLLKLSSTNHCIIAETHSDHIINRIIRRILESPDNTILDKVAIYYIEKEDEGSVARRIEIDPIFGIKEAPAEFFSQFASETNEILKAGINKMNRV